MCCGSFVLLSLFVAVVICVKLAAPRTRLIKPVSIVRPSLHKFFFQFERNLRNLVHKQEVDEYYTTVCHMTRSQVKVKSRSWPSESSENCPLQSLSAPPVAYLECAKGGGPGVLGTVPQLSRDKAPEGVWGTKFPRSWRFFMKCLNFDVLREKISKTSKNTIIKNYGPLKGEGQAQAPSPPQIRHCTANMFVIKKLTGNCDPPRLQDNT